MKTSTLALLLLALVCLAPVMVAAQGADCPAIVDQVLATVGEVCATAGRNQACYGNVSIQTVPREGVESFQFAQVGDIVDVGDVETMRLAPMNVDENLFGVAVMRLQANIPDTLPGQNVTFILMGDTQITTAVSADNSEAQPMQAFYLSTGIGDAGCREAPQSGLMVQTPEGAGEVTFSVNGVDVAMGSTVFFQAEQGEDMRVSTMQGSAALSFRGRVVPVVAGTRLDFALSNSLLPVEFDELPVPYDLGELDALPLDLLDEAIEIAPALNEAVMERLYELLDEGLPICGEDPFPACEDLPFVAGGLACALDDDGVSPLCERDFGFRWGEDGFGDFDIRDRLDDFPDLPDFPGLPELPDVDLPGLPGRGDDDDDPLEVTLPVEIIPTDIFGGGEGGDDDGG